MAASGVLGFGGGSLFGGGTESAQHGERAGPGVARDRQAPAPACWPSSRRGNGGNGANGIVIVWEYLK